MEINVRVIPHKTQRYDTVGDYLINSGLINVLVSRMGNEDFEFLVALHEIVESWLVYRRGISEQAITDFDIAFETERENGLHSLQDEPGDAKDAPYYREHQFATAIERLMAHGLGVNWQEYDDAVNSL